MKNELCNYCKNTLTYRKTDGVPKCAVCETPKKKIQVLVNEKEK